MIFLKPLIVAALALLACIVPTVSTERPRTKQQSRGTPVWTDLSKLALKEAGSEGVQETKAGTRSIACVAKASNERTTDADVFAQMLAACAAHHPQLVVVDALATQSLFRDCRSATDAAEVCRNHEIDVAVWCESNGSSIKANLLTAAADGKDMPPLALDLNGDWVASLAEQRRQMLERLGLALPAEQNVMSKVATKDVAAFRKFVEASRTLYKAIGLNDPTKRKDLCASAIELASEATALDADFIEAYLLKASCQDELGQSEAVKQTLRDAAARKNPQRHDALTLQELEGDFAHFCSGDVEAAVAHYQGILDINPSDLRALWALVDIYLTGDGLNKPTKEDISEASELAAMIVVLHPHSSIAKAIREN